MPKPHPPAKKASPGFVPFSSSHDALLGPGGWTFGAAPGVIETLVGSCVCITVWHAALRTGAACHYMLPEPPNPAGLGDPRYGREALKAMLARLRYHGIDPTGCEAKLFGGGRMFALEAPDIGQRNIDFAESALRSEHIPIVARDVGRDGYRRLRFNLNDGTVLSRFDRSEASVAFPIDPGSNGR